MGRLNPKFDSFLLVELDELDVLMLTIDPRIWMVTPSRNHDVDPLLS